MKLISTNGRKNIFFFLFLLAFFSFAHAQKSNVSSKEKATALLKKNTGNSGLKQAQVNDYRVTDAYMDRISGLFLVYTQQTYQGIPVFNKINVYAFKNDSLAYNRQDIVTTPDATASRTASYSIAPEQAIQFAAKHLSIPVSSNPKMLRRDDQQKRFVFKASVLAADSTSADLIWLPVNNGKELKLAWNVHMASPDGNDDWFIRVDAQTGAYLEKNSQVLHENQDYNCISSNKAQAKNRFSIPGIRPPFFPNKLFAPPAVSDASYNVYPLPVESPGFGDRAVETNPWLKVGATNDATTNGWHFDGTTNYNFTRGNNVFAQEGLNGLDDFNGISDVSSTSFPSLLFNRTSDLSNSPTNPENLGAAIDNLFYMNNTMHDISYQYGFDEASGNFQADNLQRGGHDNDFVHALSADGAGHNNADFLTPADGEKPRMRMFLWDNPNTTRLHINAPASIVGNYDLFEFHLTDNSALTNTGEKTGNIILINDAGANTHDGCGEIANGASLAGNIAMADFSSNCFFYPTLITNVQNAGATALIIVSDIQELQTVFLPDDENVTIPVVLISTTAANTLKANLNGLNGTLSAFSSVIRDGSLDNGVIAHEYTHGISNRLTGGPSNSACLINSEQGGEGWSDFVSFMVTTNWATATKNDGPKKRPVGTYVLFETADGAGFRTFPYTTDMSVNPLTYADLKTKGSTEAHWVGTIWCTALWDMAWGIIQQEGIDPDIYHGTKGNNIALQLVMEGMKLQPCTPGFLDARDAILKADSILYGYKHKCIIWNAFARRGMGYSAIQGSSSEINDQVAASDVPGGMQVSIKADKPVLVTGQEVTYTVTAQCNCIALSRMTVLDSLADPNLTYVPASSTGVYVAPVLIFPAGNFQPNETKTFTFKAKVGSTHAIPFTLVNDTRDPANYNWEISNGGWVETTEHSHSPSHSWFIDGSNAVVISNLESGDLLLKDNMVFSFWQILTLHSVDHGIVEITTDGGATWKDLAPYEVNNNYGGRISAANGFRVAGADNFMQRTFSLADFKDQTVRIRFNYLGFGTDLAHDGGWYVDDIKIRTAPGVLNRVYMRQGPARFAEDSLRLLFSDALALPVHFISFDVQKQNKAAALHWKVSNEINIDKYIVQRSYDGINFSPIGDVTVNNTTSNEKDYYFTDNQPLPGNNYYRIAEKDLDGKSTLSVVKLLRFDGGQLIISLQPVPTYNHTVQLRIENAGDAVFTAQLLNAVGQTIKTYSVKTGVNQLDLQNFAKGIYYLKIQLAGGEIKMIKLSIQ